MSQATLPLQKVEQLQKLLKEIAPVAVAFSGGVDSGYLCLIAFQTLGKQAIAVTANSETFPAQELEICQRVVSEIGIEHHLIHTKELAVKGFRTNEVSRCYFCKQELYQKIDYYLKEQTQQYTILDGSIADDNFEQRPGMQAAKDLLVVSPLREVGITKEELRIHGKELGLSIWDKPALACLSSRIPYGTEVTLENLTRVKEAEKFLKSNGFAQFRVRYHESIAKLEILFEDFEKLLALRDNLISEFQQIGFSSVALDLKGFRSGSMHEAFQMLPEEKRAQIALQLWNENGLPGEIVQNGKLSIITTTIENRWSILQEREKLVEKFHRAGLPYLVLRL